jgi:hypothetical protein
MRTAQRPWPLPSDVDFPYWFCDYSYAGTRRACSRRAWSTTRRTRIMRASLTAHDKLAYANRLTAAVINTVHHGPPLPHLHRDRASQPCSVSGRGFPPPHLHLAGFPGLQPTWTYFWDQTNRHTNARAHTRRARPPTRRARTHNIRARTRARGLWRNHRNSRRMHGSGRPLGIHGRARFVPALQYAAMRAEAAAKAAKVCRALFATRLRVPARACAARLLACCILDGAAVACRLIQRLRSIVYA